MNENQCPQALMIWRSHPDKIMEGSWIKFLTSDLRTENIIGEYFPTRVKTKKVIIVTHGGERGNVLQLTSFLKQLRKNQFKIALFHLGDEFKNEDISFYQYCHVIFRNYHRPEIQDSHVHFFPLGYKSGLKSELNCKKWEERQFDWSFAGQQGKRLEMINAAQKMQNGKLVVTEKFNDPRGLKTSEYAALLCNTKVVLCPKGANIETFRIYEALEAGAIPLVEDDGGLIALKENLSINGFRKIIKERIPFVKEILIKALKVNSYWISAFGNNFPCPIILEWDNLPQVFARISLKKKSEETQRWWEEYKNELKDKVTKYIRYYL